MSFLSLPTVPILGVTGINGAGKSMLAVEQCIQHMLGGRDVFSTVPIEYTDRKGERFASQPITSLTQLIQLRDCTVLLDDIAVIFSSRSGGSMPSEVVTFMQTLRHKNVTLIWTAPNFARADVQVRALTQALAVVRPMLRWKKRGEWWPKPYLCAVGVLDTASVPTDAQPTDVLARRFWRPLGSPARGAYDTHAPTPQIGRLLRSGPCPDCGGARKAVSCSADLHDQLHIEPPLDFVDWYASQRQPSADGQIIQIGRRRA